MIQILLAISLTAGILATDTAMSATPHLSTVMSVENHAPIDQYSQKCTGGSSCISPRLLKTLDNEYVQQQHRVEPILRSLVIRK